MNKIPIDMVFTYVDGNDSEFIKILNKYKKIRNTITNPDIRWKNIDEIKYSVRSVIKNIKFIRTIYIVTNGQIPPIDEYLFTSGKVKLITHNDIIPKKYLPTFCSGVIESYLHNIPDLSEIFLHNNDDWFNFSKINTDDLYEIKNGQIKLKIIQDIDRNLGINNYFYHIIQNLNNKRLIYTKNIFFKYYKNASIFVNNHYTKIIRKSTLKLMENKFSKELHKLRKNKFRTEFTIHYFSLALSIDNLNNNNILKNNLVLFPNELCYFKRNWDNPEKNFELLLKYKPKFACLNMLPYQVKNEFIMTMKKLL